MNTDTPIAAPTKLLGGRFKWLRICFLIYAVSEIFIAVGSGFLLLQGGVSYGPEFGITPGDYLTGFGGVLLLFSFIGTVILFSMFSYRAVKNLKIWEVRHLETSPGWAVGWYFVPIANLWKPYGVMDQIWTGSHEIDPRDYAPPTSRLPVWWLAWVLTNIVSNVSFRMGNKAGMWEEYLTDIPLFNMSLYADIVSSVLGLVATFSILPVLKVISEKQDSKIRGDLFA